MFASAVRLYQTCGMARSASEELLWVTENLVQMLTDKTLHTIGFLLFSCSTTARKSVLVDLIFDVLGTVCHKDGAVGDTSTHLRAFALQHSDISLGKIPSPWQDTCHLDFSEGYHVHHSIQTPFKSPHLPITEQLQTPDSAALLGKGIPECKRTGWLP